MLINLNFKIMTNEEMLAIADKIKNKTATKEEILAFTKEYSQLVNEIKEDLK